MRSAKRFSDGTTVTEDRFKEVPKGNESRVKPKPEAKGRRHKRWLGQRDDQ